jgi:hypothetical protein
MTSQPSTTTDTKVDQIKQLCKEKDEIDAKIAQLQKDAKGDKHAAELEQLRKKRLALLYSVLTLMGERAELREDGVYSNPFESL